MNDDDERSPGLRRELEGPDRAGYATSTTGAGGESGRDDGPDRATHPGADERPLTSAEDQLQRLDEINAGEDDPSRNDESVIGHAGSGGAPPGFVAPPPGTDWPDPLGGEDEERELERRTR